MLIDSVVGNEFRYEIYLCKPYTTTVAQHQIIGCLTNCINIKNYTQKIQDVNELNFDIYTKWNDINNTENTLFDSVIAGQTILLERYIDDTLLSQEYMFIYESELIGSDKDIKTVKCYSKHYQWNKIKIREFKEEDTLSSLRKLYDGIEFDYLDNTKGGMLDYILQEKLENTWTVSYISSSLLNVYRLFNISEQSLLAVVKTMESMFNCIFFFNSTNQTISIKSYAELTGDSGLILSGENYLKEIKEQTKLDEIVTRLYVEGKDIGIQAVNITGQAYIDDFSYFRSTTYMSQSLLDALTAYDVLTASYTGTFAGYLSALQGYQTSLITKEQELSVLQTELTELEDAEDACIKFGTFEGQNYAYYRNLVLSKTDSIQTKEGEITTVQGNIVAVQSNISALATTLSYDTNFTSAQLKELLQYIFEDTVKCETEDENELILFGRDILELRSTPPIEITLSLVDIYSCATENYNWNKIVLGSLVNVEFPDLHIQTMPRITQINHDISGNNLSITVSNKTYFNDDISYITSLIALANKTTKTLDSEQTKYLEYNKDKDTVIKTDTALTADSNPISCTNSLAIARRGLWMKKINESGGVDAEMRLMDDKLLITKDNWATISTALTSDGVYCNALWVLTNTDGSVQIDGNKISITNMDLELTRDNGNNTIYMNPDVGIQILQGSTPVFYADTNGSLNLKNIYLTNEDGSISISPDIISILDGKIEIKSRDGVSTIIDEYGIDPRFMDYFKNMIWNSSFEAFDATTYVPMYWSAGVSDSNSSFYGTYSMKLEASESSIQTNAAGCNPNWYENMVTRVSFYSKQGQVKIEVYDDTNSSYFTLTESSVPTTGTSITFDRNSNWLDSRCSVSFDPTESGHTGCTKLLLKFTNVHATEATYIDAVQLTPDFTGKWSQLYKDGQYSTSAADIPDIRVYTANVHVQDEEPVTPLQKDFWIDTNDYSRYDLTNATTSIPILMSDNEFYIATTAGITLTLETPSQDGVVKIIKNASNGNITINGYIDNLTTKVLASYASLSLISGNSVWWIV